MKRSFFISNLAEWHFLSLYGTGKEKSFEYWLRFCSFPTRYIGKTIFFFCVLWQLNKAIQYLRQTASRWNRYAMTFLRQKRAITYLCSCKRLVLFYRYDLCCQIMILPYSHSLSVQSVARNGYGYIRTMQRWNSCGLWQKPLNCLERFYRKGVCVIDNAVKTIQKKNNKCGIGNRGKTKIVVKEHFSEKGKTMEELLTDVVLEKAKQTIA